MNKHETYKALKIRRRPFYAWILRILWLVWLLFWLEVAVGSHLEWEPQASRISWAVLFISIAVGLILWVIGIKKTRKRDHQR